MSHRLHRSGAATSALGLASLLLLAPTNRLAAAPLSPAPGGAAPAIDASEARPHAPARRAAPLAVPLIELELGHLCDTIRQGLASLPDLGRHRSVAIAAFSDGGGRAASDARRIVADYVSVRCLIGLSGFTVFDADADLRGDDPMLVEAARAAGVDVVITGEVTRGRNAYTMTARLIVPEDGASNSAILNPLPLQETDAYIDALLRARTPTGAALRSAAAPGWGQIYNGEVTKGVLFISTEVILLGAALGFYLASKDAEATYGHGVPHTVAEADEVERYGAMAGVTLGIAGAVWVGGILDAWLGGYRYDPERAFDRRGRLTPMGGAEWAGGGWLGTW